MLRPEGSVSSFVVADRLVFHTLFMDLMTCSQQSRASGKVVWPRKVDIALSSEDHSIDLIAQFGRQVQETRMLLGLRFRSSIQTGQRSLCKSIRSRLRSCLSDVLGIEVEGDWTLMSYWNVHGEVYGGVAGERSGGWRFWRISLRGV